MPGPYSPDQTLAECGHYYPDVLRLRDERKPDGTFVRILDCAYCGQYELPLDIRHLSKELTDTLKKFGREIGIEEGEVASIRKKRLEEMLSPEKKLAGQTLQSLLETAIQQRAEAIEMEFVTEGLEVTFVRGNFGFGDVIEDHESIETIIGELFTQAGLEHNSRGRFRWVYDGKSYQIRAMQYESFGEMAFRLILKKIGRRARHSR
jgi:hypothetical protein